MWIEISDEDATYLEMATSYTANRYSDPSWQDKSQLEQTRQTAAKLKILYRKFFGLKDPAFFAEKFNRIELTDNDEEILIRALIRYRNDFSDQGRREKAEQAENVLQKVLRFLG